MNPESLLADFWGSSLFDPTFLLSKWYRIHRNGRFGGYEHHFVASVHGNGRFRGYEHHFVAFIHKIGCFGGYEHQITGSVHRIARFDG